MRKKKYDLAFGMGMACSCSESLRRAGLQYLSFPGDWTIPSLADDEQPALVRDLPYRARILVSPSADFFAAENIRNLNVVSNTGREVYANIKTRYVFNHDFPVGSDLNEELPKVAEKYRRRYERLLSLIRASKRVLVLRVDRPNAAEPTPTEDAREVIDLLNKTFAPTRFEMLVLSYEKGRAPEEMKEETLADDLMRWTFDYKNPKEGALPHEIHVPMVGELLASRLAVKDYRTREERKAHAKSKRLARYARVGATNVFGYHLARLKAKFQKKNDCA